MISLNVLTISGKKDTFVVDNNKLVGDIRRQIEKNHRYLTVPMDQETKLLFQGIELEDNMSVSSYGIKDGANIQVINNTRPVNIGRSYENRRLSESLPVFENYAPSPYTGTNVRQSPNNNDLVITLQQKVLELTQRLEKMEKRLERVEDSNLLN